MGGFRNGGVEQEGQQETKASRTGRAVAWLIAGSPSVGFTYVTGAPGQLFQQQYRYLASFLAACSTLFAFAATLCSAAAARGWGRVGGGGGGAARGCDMLMHAHAQRSAHAPALPTPSACPCKRCATTLHSPRPQGTASRCVTPWRSFQGPVLSSRALHLPPAHCKLHACLPSPAASCLPAAALARAACAGAAAHARPP